MIAKKRILLLLLFLVSVSLAEKTAAITIQGTVYDPYLEKLDKALVTINTNPKQTFITEEGKYTLQVPPGNYLLKAEYTNGVSYSWEEQINAQQDGIYNIDIVMQQDIEIEDVKDMPNEIKIEIENKGIDWNWIWLSLLGIIFIALLILGSKKRFFTKKKESSIEGAQDEVESRIINILKNEGGRATQKEIRKKLGLSEAKISLVISDLENRKKIRKIKKGRGNIITLNKL